MKRLLTAALLILASYAAALAANSKQTVTQVTTAVSLTTNVDYHITSDEPFSTTGSIDIVNTDHAVVIFDALKPSLAKKQLGFITINGEAAKDGTNCQVRIWDRGAMILPYGGSAFRPLTVFDSYTYKGESTNNFTEGHNGSGYMKNMPTGWDNRVMSFKLKRGYMVTFALQKAGKGYSRCFIAANADIEMNLPALMSARISSYRLFKWQNTSKVGVSDWLNATALSKLNAQTTFTWGVGSDMLPDVEVVPHHIDESWPSAADCGKAEFSPHMKANNEPRNEADHGTWTMEQILANWEAMMATGMRLCTPSSWDGSDYWNATGFLANFINEIDSRGWRVDIIDLHGYWDEGSFTTNVNNWAQTFKRPVWITEWVWGSSWSPIKGIFSKVPESRWDNPTDADKQENKSGVSRILDNLNSNNACERYFYWNGERNCSKIMNGDLTPAGEYFATMKTNGPGYTNYGNYIPKAPPAESITDLTGTFTPQSGALTLKWSNKNGEFTTGGTLQRKEGTGAWVTIYTYKGKEMESKTSISFKDQLEIGGKYSYRVIDTVYISTKTTITSNIYVFNTFRTTGTTDVQHGTFSSIPANQVYAFFEEPYFAELPVIVCGSATYANTAPAGVVNNPLRAGQGQGTIKKYEYISYQEMPWYNLVNNEYTKTNPTKEESTNFIVAASGNGMIGDLHYEAGNITSVKNNVVEVTFAQPFEEAPVVMVTPINASPILPPMTWRIYDVTKEGFKLQLLHQKGETKAYTARMVGYFAIEKGSGHDGKGGLYTVGSVTATFKNLAVTLPYGDDISLTDPKAMVQLQTYNHQAAAIMRISSVNATGVSVRMQVDPTDPNMVLTSTRTATEDVGYIIISTDPDYDGIQDIGNKTSFTRPADYRAYDLSGRQIVNGKWSNGQLHKGIYIINGQKVLIK